jgi:hypothetical protein
MIDRSPTPVTASRILLLVAESRFFDSAVVALKRRDIAFAVMNFKLGDIYYSDVHRFDFCCNIKGQLCALS